MTADSNPTQRDPVVEHAHRCQKTLGESILAELEASDFATPAPSDDRNSEDTTFDNFLHALNTSDWVGAAYFLHAGDSPTLKTLLADSSSLVAQLSNNSFASLYQAAHWFNRDRRQWRGQMQEIYLFGRLPVYSPNAFQGQPNPRSYIFKPGVAQHSQALTNLIPAFYEYERVNQLYQQAGSTTAGAPIRFAQGHNWTFAHARLDLADEQRFASGRPRVLMNWDAHRDLGSPFLHLAQEMATMKEFIDYDKTRLLDLIQNATTREELVEVTLLVNIAGWILPLLYTKAFESDGVSDFIIVLPKEAVQTSQRSYWPLYGTYELEIGDARIAPPPGPPPAGHRGGPLPPFEIFQGVQSVSEDLRFQSMHPAFAAAVEDRIKVRVHIVDADNTDEIMDKVDGRDIYLSVDVDYAGTVQPGGVHNRANHNPHYPLNGSDAEEARHTELLARFGQFYEQAAEQIRAVSIANSPDFTTDETRRRPTAKVLEYLTGGQLESQPNWVRGELNRSEPPQG